MAEIKIGVITASDRASQGIYEDISGVAIQETMKAYLKSEFEIVYRCIADEQELLERTMVELCDELDPIIKQSEFYKQAPFELLNGIIRFGTKDDDEPEYELLRNNELETIFIRI
jgi:chaperone required for assembly of F1-ATPase